MILWLVLFALVISISFVLALQSMHDYQESPSHFDREYGLFLVRNTSFLTAPVIDLIYDQIIKDGLIISFERLFKGPKSALVVFGPKDVLARFSTQLNLLELEDYTSVNKDFITAWEVGVKKPDDLNKKMKDSDDFFKHLPVFSETEQFWWQLILQAETKGGKRLFKSKIRAVIMSEDLNRRKQLAQNLQNLASGYLTKVPKPFTQSQIIDLYKERSIVKDATSPVFQTEEIVKLILL